MPATGVVLFWLSGLVLADLLGELLLAGPAVAQEAVTIAQAQAALEAARSTRAVRVLAAPELDAAEEALERALAARDAGQPSGEVEHLAYLAERRAAIARMHARERQLARALRKLSAVHAVIGETRALEAAAAEGRARALAQRLARFDVREDRQGLLLTPHEPWFEADLTPAPRALRALAEAARLLGELPEREVVVLGYALRAAPHAAGRGAGTEAMGQLPAHYQEADAASQRAIDPDDLGCVRADVVRAFLISHGVDPRRIVASCVAPQGAPQASAGATAIAILTEQGSAVPRLSAGAPTDDPPTTTR
jgi:outer membrane protein OmpA-like peptidoglycan-associated protein